MPVPLTTPQIHENDVGTRLVCTVKRSPNSRTGQLIDLSLALQVFLRFRRPDRTTFDVEASLVQPEESDSEPGSDGRIEYYTLEGDLTPSGEWSMQGILVLPSGVWSTQVVTFPVYPNLG